MPASLVSGAYTMLAVFESASTPDSWYRLLKNNTTGELSCDCPVWIFPKNGQRSCPHTDIGTLIVSNTLPMHTINNVLNQQTIVETMKSWWHGGLSGTWNIDERPVQLGNKGIYLFVTASLTHGTGNVSTCAIGFSNPRLDRTRAYERIAGWCGYAIAADIARLGGFPMAGQQPEHFKLPKSVKAAKKQLSSFLRLKNTSDLGDGLRPEERAEQTLQFFLGETLYAQLETNHFLDISSYLTPGRVYRLRRDYPNKKRERRLRIFENGRYAHDFCIVRNQPVPEGDHILSLFLGLMSNEAQTISVVTTPHG